MSVAIKLTCICLRCPPQLRRLSVPSESTLAQLLQAIPVQLPTLAGVTFVLKYVDDEGDHISLSQELEWQEFRAIYAGHPVLHLSLVEEKPKAAPAPPAEAVPAAMPATQPAEAEVPARPLPPQAEPAAPAAPAVARLVPTLRLPLPALRVPSVPTSPAVPPSPAVSLSSADSLESTPSSDYELVTEEPPAPAEDAPLSAPAEERSAPPAETEPQRTSGAPWTPSLMTKQAANAALAVFSAVTRFASSKPQGSGEGAAAHGGDEQAAAEQTAPPQ